MADSDALRSRRKRLHAQNDHSICKHRPRPGAVPVLVPVPDTGEFDPGEELRLLAGRLSAAYAADPANAALARELRQTLLVLRDPGGGGDPELEGLFAALDGA